MSMMIIYTIGLVYFICVIISLAMRLKISFTLFEGNNHIVYDVSHDSNHPLITEMIFAIIDLLMITDHCSNISVTLNLHS